METTNVWKILGRIFYALPFIAFGLTHLTQPGVMAAYVPAFIPGGVIWVYVTGIAMILAAISIISGRLIKTSSLLLGLMLLTFVATIHIPGMFNPDLPQAMIMTNLLKDIALMGGALVIGGTAKKKKAARGLEEESTVVERAA